jgi:ABC-2 type transport system ATP-binding protein
MAQTLIQHLSKGYRQRVGLADALVAAPPLLILDEPTAGLDPNQIREVRKLIRDLGKNHTIFLSTHILSEVETTCDRAIVIHRGRVVAEGSLDELRRHRRADTALLVVRDPEDRAQRLLESLPSVRQVRAERRDTELARLVVHYDEGLRDIASAVEAGVTALVGSGIGVREASLQKPTLEEVFAELTHSEDQKTDQVEALP